MEWMGEKTDKGGLAWAKFGKKYLPVRVISPQLLSFHMEGLKKDSYCTGCGLPCVNGLSSVSAHVPLLRTLHAARLLLSRENIFSNVFSNVFLVLLLC